MIDDDLFIFNGKCMLCGEVEATDQLRYMKAGKDPKSKEQLWAWKCRRCRLPMLARPIWDQLRDQERIVVKHPEDGAAVQYLRELRIQLDVALRPKPKTKEMG